jgi:hypothetical protein
MEPMAWLPYSNYKVLIALQNEHYESERHLWGERDRISAFFWGEYSFAFAGRIMENLGGINSGRRTSFSQSEPASPDTLPLVQLSSWIVSHNSPQIFFSLRVRSFIACSPLIMVIAYSAHLSSSCSLP